MSQHHAASKLDRRQTNRIPQNWDGLLQESAASMGQIPKSQFFRWFKTYKSVQELAVSTGCKSKTHHLGMVGIPLIKNGAVLTLGWFMALIPHYRLHHSRTRSPWVPLGPLGSPWRPWHHQVVGLPWTIFDLVGTKVRRTNLSSSYARGCIPGIVRGYEVLNPYCSWGYTIYIYIYCYIYVYT